MVEDLAVMGAPEELVEQFMAAGESDDPFKVWPENWEAVLLFLLCSTQWRFAPSGHLYGMDFASVESVMRMRGVRRQAQPEMIQKIRIMESAALEVIK